LGSSWIRPRCLFSKRFNELLFGWILWMYRAIYQPNLKSVALPIPEIKGGSQKISGHGESGMVPSERALESFYRSSMITFPLSLRASEILSLLRSSTSLFPTPSLVSPKFPHVPLRVGGWFLGYEERRCWANCPCNWFPRFPTYVILIHQRYRRTDGRTDDVQSQDHALHYTG